MAVCGSKLTKLVWLGLLAAVLAVPAGAEALADNLQVSPNRVDIGAFFRGAEVEVKGALPAGAEAVVEVRGTTIQQTLRRLGRRWGLWMTVGEIEVDQAPNLYLVLSSAPKIPELSGAPTPWGLASLKSQVRLQGALAPEENDRFLKEFLELKISEDLYKTLPGAICISNSPGGGAAFQGAFQLPAKVPPGPYQVRLSVLEDGRLLEQKTAEFTVKMVGFPALFASLAYEHAALYGVLAVLIAIATGFIMGFLFKGRTEH
ncbi:MAG: TIGR02186 family protein [Desulfobaccales bacterium]